MTPGSYHGSDTTEMDFVLLEREFRHLARELTPADRQRLALPPTVWPRIEFRTRQTIQHRNDRDTLALAPPPPSWYRRFGRPAFALAAGLLVVVFGAAALISIANQDAQVLAAGSLGNDGLPVAFSGGAEVEFRANASINELEITLASLPETAADSFYELWMMDPVSEGLVSLGPISTAGADNGSTTYVVLVPASVGVERFPVVDVSIEPTDGDPTHSGQSILRGTLKPVGET